MNRVPRTGQPSTEGSNPGMSQIQCQGRILSMEDEGCPKVRRHPILHRELVATSRRTMSSLSTSIYWHQPDNAFSVKLLKYNRSANPVDSNPIPSRMPWRGLPSHADGLAKMESHVVGLTGIYRDLVLGGITRRNVIRNSPNVPRLGDQKMRFLCGHETLT